MGGWREKVWAERHAHTGTQVYRYTGMQVCKCRQRAVLKLGDETSDFIHPNKPGAGPWAHRAKLDSVPGQELNLMASGNRNPDPNNHSIAVKD